VTGCDGQLGWELVRCLQGFATVVPANRSRLDLSRPDAIGRTLDDLMPDIVVNAAAYTAVDKAEAEPALAQAVNAKAPGAIARWCAGRGVVFVHYSTDYVFDGTGSDAWTEEDAPAPRSTYGRSKRDGELAVASAGCAHLLFRTSWVYAARGRNFLRTMLRLATEREELRVVDDQVGAPTWARTVAQATALVLARSGRSRDERLSMFKARGGLFHLSARGSCSWHGFAQRIFARSSDPARCLRSLVPIATAAYPTPARRPLNSRLAVDRLESTWGLQLPAWEDALDLCLADMAA
jgi:dTDP-4-dehydrorhamnose reductase